MVHKHWWSGMLVAAAVVLAASAALAQRGGGPFRGHYAIPWATPQNYDGAFRFCRVVFRGNPYGDGGDWSVDFPRADENLMFRFSELTSSIVGRTPDGDFNHVVVRLTDPLLFRCPFIMMTEVGDSYFDDNEAAALRAYLLKGGFLWADDFWGEYAWGIWAEQIGKAMPLNQYPMVDVPLQHELFHTLYDVRRIPQIPSINFWYGSGRQTSERGRGSIDPHVRAIFDDHGRIMVLITHNTDFGDAFEREGDSHEYFLAFAPEGYAFGVNALIYSMTH